MVKEIKTDPKTGRRTVEDVVAERVRFEAEQAKVNKEPELTREEKNKIAMDQWKAMHGLDLDSSDR